MKKIVLTGGGTTGHVAVNLALIPKLLSQNWKIYYIGSKKGIERELIAPLDVEYIPITTGKLRRYFSWENFKDFFRVIRGIFQAIGHIRKIKPNIVFSKGGYVSVPVVIGAWFNRVPALSHESDLTPGLANKLCQPFVKKVMVTFPETIKYIKNDKGYFLGPVIRDSLKNGNPEDGKKFLGIENDKPNILVMGGSLGAMALNGLIRDNLDSLTKNFNIIHAVGKNNLADVACPGYIQKEYIKDELKDVMALADLVISRAGSNAIFEFLYYKKPMLLIPLPTSQSRGDQIQNAKNFRKNGYAEVIHEEDLTRDAFLTYLDKIYTNRNSYIENMEKFDFRDAVGVIYDELEKMKKDR